jgi:hypothetical protein
VWLLTGSTTDKHIYTKTSYIFEDDVNTLTVSCLRVAEYAAVRQTGYEAELSVVQRRVNVGL